MMQMSSVYDGKVANDLDKDELMEAILSEFKLVSNRETIKAAMNAAFTEGWKRGEDFGKDYYNNKG